MPDAPSALNLALCQVDLVVGDIDGNRQLIGRLYLEQAAAGADVVVFPELAVTGYPPEDLLLQHHFLDAAAESMNMLAAMTGEAALIVGFPERDGDAVFNSLAVMQNGSLQTVYRKILLPNYGVFDERRYFTPGRQPQVIELNGRRVGLSVCEDIWSDEPVVAESAAAGAELLINISASPYHAGKAAERETMIADRAARFGLAIAYCNSVGGQDELVFDGSSFVVDGDGTVVARAQQFAEANLTVSMPAAGASVVEPASVEPLLATPEAEVYAALTVGLRDYIDKNGFPGAIVGVSGGIDSALAICLAVDALGADRVTGVVMPSPYNSSETQSDARDLCDRLGVAHHDLPIEPAMKAFDSILAPVLAGSPSDQTEENIQARIRGTLLMALSNKFGSVVVTTGNKSEMAVGYATLYGDMAGGFAVLKDVPKTLVFALSKFRNAGGLGHQAGVIPVGIIERPPSAELKFDQRDEDALGSYDLLDRVIELYVEQDLGLDAIVAAGIDPDYAVKTIKLIDASEYKRRQAPPGVKISTKAFGRDRRLPITATRRFG